MTLVGVSCTHLTALEAAVGGLVPVVRDYGWLGHPPTVIAAGGVYGRGKYGAGPYGGPAPRMLVWSCQFRTDSGPVKAVDVTAGRYDTQIRGFVDQLAKAPPSSHGKHVLIFQPDLDTTPAITGTPVELSAAVLHCHQLTRARTTTIRLGVCLTGSNLPSRGKTWLPLLYDADLVVIDRPYQMAVSQSGVSLAGPAVDWLTANLPGKTVGIGEWGSVPKPGRATWIANFAKALNTARFRMVEFACYRDDVCPAGDFHVTGTADAKALIAAIKPRVS